MIVFPLIATVVSAVFAVLLLRQYARKRRVQQLAWGVSMAMFAVASLVVMYASSQTWDPTSYKIFYLFGAMLNVPWLALGSVALLNRRELTMTALVIVLVLSIFGLFKVLSSHPCEAITGPRGHQTCVAAASTTVENRIFDRKDVPSGSEVWHKDRSVRSLAIWYSTVAYVIVIGIAILTSRPRKGVAPPSERVRANLLIAVGVTIVAIGSTALVRYGRGAGFSITLAIGVVVMFIGFLLASRAPRHHVEQPGESPT
ncbi:MAG: hypothetical protein ACXVQY_05860 [Actinomycetota bacterium]